MMLPPFIAGKLFMAVAVAIVAGVVGWTANGWRLNGKIATIKAEYAQAETVAHQQALQDLVTATAEIKRAADEYTTVETRTSRKIDVLRKEVGEYAKQNPLPAECRPDAIRVRKLSDSIDAANEAITR